MHYQIKKTKDSLIWQTTGSSCYYFRLNDVVNDIVKFIIPGYVVENVYFCIEYPIYLITNEYVEI
jgi:hypothetical protein